MEKKRGIQYWGIWVLFLKQARCLFWQVNSLQHSCLENPMDGGAWWAAVHGVTKSRTQLSDFPFTFHFPALEKEMATRSSVLAWRIPGLWSLVGCHLWGCTTQQQQQQQQQTSFQMPGMWGLDARKSLRNILLVVEKAFSADTDKFHFC